MKDLFQHLVNYNASLPARDMLIVNTLIEPSFLYLNDNHKDNINRFNYSWLCY